MLEAYIKEKLKEKDILLMTHLVIGYPSLDESFRIIEKMVAAGVDIMELQIPFSEPIADGPVILHANQKSLAGGTTVGQCLEFAQKAAADFDIPFLFMSYYNILYKYGVQKFAETMSQNGLRGAIVPDLPPEEGGNYLEALETHNLDPILIFSPATPDSRMQYLSSFGRGFMYCVARKGVTGDSTAFSKELDTYLARCRQATSLPLALGFGVKSRADIDFLKGRADIAVIGTQTIRLVDDAGVEAVTGFIEGLR
ncbi:MAG: tryptophan synthase subunit alpha [Desulfobacterales bacterium]|nr:tryptophan synthase subunit alpha [Desulfobacterales bacterium]